MVSAGDEAATDEDSSQGGGQEVMQYLNNLCFANDVCPNPNRLFILPKNCFHLHTFWEMFSNLINVIAGDHYCGGNDRPHRKWSGELRIW